MDIECNHRYVGVIDETEVVGGRARSVGVRVRVRVRVRVEGGGGEGYPPRSRRDRYLASEMVIWGGYRV